MQSTIVSVNEQKTEDIDFLKLLNECVVNINRFTQLVFCVGTSCDNKKLRSKLYILHEKLFKNILLQKEAIRIFFKSSRTETTNINAKNNNYEINYSEKNERLLCFTLATLVYLEKMIQKLTQLIQLFPTADRIDLVVDLGFDENFANSIYIDDVSIANENKNTKLSQIAENDLELQILKNRLKTITNLREEIESMDVNLARYHIKSESNVFMKKILEYNTDYESKFGSFIKSENMKNGAKVWMLPSLKKFINNRKKCIFTLLMVMFLIIIVVSIACGLVYGM